MNPYLEIEHCVARLVREHKKHPRLFVSYDFDDTVFNFHDATEDRELNLKTHAQVIELLRECKERGFYLILFTAGKPERFDRMRQYCKELGIEPDSINKNAVDGLPFGNHGKIYYNIFLDDRAGLGAAVETLRQFLATLPPLTPVS